MRDLKADLEICNKATPGPWRVSGDINHLVFAENGCSGEPIALIADCGQLHHADTKEHVMEMQANAAFIAAARTGWPKAIERAIKAEKKNIESYDLLYGAFDKVKDEAEQLKADNATLREENDLQRDSIQQLSAQAAGLREGLEEIQARCELRTMDDDAHYENYYEAKRLLSQPDPGAEIMERMKKLEAVAEAVKSIDEWEDDGKDYGSVLFPQELYYLLMDALDALEGPAHE